MPSPERQAKAHAFRALLQEELAALEGMRQDQRLSWQELLSYLVGLVYHERPAQEQDGPVQLICASARSDEFVQEVDMVRRTMPQIHREEGIALGRDEGRREEAVHSRQQMLIMLLREKFGELSAQAEQVIATTQDIARLDGWLKAVVNARSLDAMKIS